MRLAQVSTKHTYVHTMVEVHTVYVALMLHSTWSYYIHESLFVLACFSSTG